MGSTKANKIKGKYEAKLEFPEREGDLTANLFHGGGTVSGYFLKLHNERIQTFSPCLT